LNLCLGLGFKPYRRGDRGSAEGPSLNNDQVQLFEPLSVRKFLHATLIFRYVEMIGLSENQNKVPVPFEKSLYLLHPYNATLVTCKGKNEEINVLAVAWIIPVGVNPPLLAMSIRPERYSHDLIMETGEFVVNIPTFNMVKEVLLCGRRSGRNFEKFKKVSLSPQKARKVNVPVIKECVAHLECKLAKTVNIGDHTLIIGQVVAAYAAEGCFEEVYDLTKFHPCLHLGKNFFTTCTEERVEPDIANIK